ncbi:hypothetical protein L3X38_009987 [Prunus dulcis]|uniref:Uncharacterized protein n=1 Tax=Prunus dulcis TaxID=3755 RepID=A0AAD4ZCW1_PRUDU|nr:hypothetical protein L3X38_009987 [Prunus dulcis]
MKDDETLSVYLSRLLELVNQMKGYGEDLSKGRLVQKLLISLTKEFDPVCYVIEQTKDIETIEVQEVLAALRGFAQRLDRHAESTTEKAFSSMSINQKGSQSNSSFGSNKSKKNWKSTVQVEVTIPWNDNKSSMTFEFDSEASDSPQSVQSPLRTQAVSDLQATMNLVPPVSPVSTSETYDHTPRKWKSLDEVYAQCKMSIIEPENFTEAVKDEA